MIKIWLEPGDTERQISRYESWVDEVDYWIGMGETPAGFRALWGELHWFDSVRLPDKCRADLLMTWLLSMWPHDGRYKPVRCKELNSKGL